MDFLYKNGYKLPDEAKKQIKDLYVQPDFYYKESVCIFCDGTPHDKDEVKEKDIKQRALLREHGYDVIAYYYKDSLEELVNKRKDIFKKVK